MRECDWVPGCFYLIRREVIERVGLFDPRFFLYYEEVDHCRAVRKAGRSVTYYPFTQVVHLGGESALSEGPITRVGRQISALQIESELLYFRKHHGMSGAFAAVSLAMLGDMIVACNSLVRHQNGAQAAAAMRHSWTISALCDRFSRDTLNRYRSTEYVPMFNNIREDLRAHDGKWGAQGFWVMVVYRFGRWRYGVRPAIVRKFFSLIYHVLYKFVQIITGIELPCEVDRGTQFRHRSLWRHHHQRIRKVRRQLPHSQWRRCGPAPRRRKMCAHHRQQCRYRGRRETARPDPIGDNVVIGANAVVLCDVPDNSIAVGVPAIVKTPPSADVGDSGINDECH